MAGVGADQAEVVLKPPTVLLGCKFAKQVQATSGRLRIPVGAGGGAHAWEHYDVVMVD